MARERNRPSGVDSGSGATRELDDRQERTAARAAEVWWFFALAYGWMWALNAPRVLETAGLLTLPAALGWVLGTLAVFGPAMAAFLLTYRVLGRTGARALWRRGWRSGPNRWLLLPALLLLPLLAGITALLMLALGIELPWHLSPPLILLVPIGLALFVLQGLPEEFGWRGYALDRLQARWNPLLASLVLGAAHALWHLPLHFIDGTVQAVIPVWQMLVVTMAQAVVYTWLYNRSSGSVLLVALLHTTGNLSSAFVPWWVPEAGRWLLFAVVLVVVVTLAARGLGERRDAVERLRPPWSASDRESA